MLNAYRQLDVEGNEIWYAIDEEIMARELSQRGQIVQWKRNDPFQSDKWKPYGHCGLLRDMYERVKVMTYTEAIKSGITSWHYYRVRRTKDYREYRDKYMKISQKN